VENISPEIAPEIRRPFHQTGSPKDRERISFCIYEEESRGAPSSFLAPGGAKFIFRIPPFDGSQGGG